MKEKFKIIIMDCIILESDNLKRMDDSVLFQLPPELLCGLLSKLPGEDLKQFGNSFYNQYSCPDPGVQGFTDNP